MPSGTVLQFPQRGVSSLLEGLLADPTIVNTLDANAIANLQIEISSKQIQLASLASLLASQKHEEPQKAATDAMLTPEEVAKRLGVSVQWVYKNWKIKLPFGVKVSGKQLRFSERKLERFLKMRQAA